MLRISKNSVQYLAFFYAKLEISLRSGRDEEHVHPCLTITSSIKANRPFTGEAVTRQLLVSTPARRTVVKLFGNLCRHMLV